MKLSASKRSELGEFGVVVQPRYFGRGVHSSASERSVRLRRRQKRPGKVAACSQAVLQAGCDGRRRG